MKVLIVNADDLGLSPGVNEGILRAAREGCVRSATALAGAPAFREGVEAFAALEGRGLGLHLNLTGSWDRPEGSVPPGFFHGGPLPLLLAALSGRLDRAFARASLRRQIETFLETGLHPTHLDGHHHIHVFPGMAALVAELAVEYRIPALRLPLEAGRPGLKGRLVARLARRAAPCFHEAGLRRPDRFFGFRLAGRRSFGKRFRESLERLVDGVTEVMVHPGTGTPDVPFDAYVRERARELQSLTSPGILERVEALGIRLASFSILGEEKGA